MQQYGSRILTKIKQKQAGTMAPTVQGRGLKAT